MKKEKYYPPKHATGQFHCPHCGVYAKQFWANIEAKENESGHWNNIINQLSQFSDNLDDCWTISICQHCGQIII